jgi:hypothetical protein
LNGACGLIENYIGQKNIDQAKIAYANLKTTYPELARLLNRVNNSAKPYAFHAKTLTNLSDGETRFLFLAAQMETDARGNINQELTLAILEHLRDVYASARRQNPNRLTDGNFLYNLQTSRYYWDAVARLAEYDITQVNIIKAEVERARSLVVKDVFYIERIYQDIYFLYVLARLEEYKKQGAWSEALQLLDEADKVCVSTEQITELTFQRAEFEELKWERGYTDRALPAFSVTEGTVNGEKKLRFIFPQIDSSTKTFDVDYDPNNLQRKTYLDLAVAARNKDYQKILEIADQFVDWDQDEKLLTSSFTAHPEFIVRQTSDKKKTVEQYNAEFLDNLTCAYLEALNALRTAEQSVPRSVFAPDDLSVAFSSFKDKTAVDAILNKAGVWTDTERRIMFLAAQLFNGDQPKPKDIYEKIISRYPLTPPRGYPVSVNGTPQTYYYNSDAKRAHWEAQAGLLNYYVKQKMSDELQKVFDTIKGEYDQRFDPQNAGYAPATDAAYIENLYFNAAENLLTFYGYTAATRDENKLAELIKSILAGVTADKELYCKALLAKAEQYLRLSGDPNTVNKYPAVLSALDDGMTDIRSAIEKALEITLDALGAIFATNAGSLTSDGYYTYCNQRIRQVLLQYDNALPDDKNALQNAYDALEKLCKPVNEGGLGLSNDSLTEKLLLDTIIVNKNALIVENRGEETKIKKAGQATELEDLGYVPQPESENALDEYLNIYDKDCVTEFQKQLLIGILLLLAAQTRISGAEPAESGDDDMAEMAVEILLGLRPNDGPRELTPEKRQEETVKFMGQEYFNLLEPRLRLDYAWALLKPNNPSATALDVTERIAKTIIEQSDPAEIISEAKDLLRLAWSKGNNPQWAIDGQEIEINGDKLSVGGYAALIAKPTDFADKRVRGAIENLISLYGYNPLTRDAESNKGKLAELVGQLREANDAALSPQLKPTVKKLYVKALLAQAETYSRQKKIAEMENTLDVLLKCDKSGAVVNYSGLLSGEIGIPEKTEEYYAYCEQRVRLVLQQAQNSNESPTEIDTRLAALPGELNLINPNNLTEKLLNSFITVNKPNITPKETKTVMTDLGFDITANREYFEKTCQTNYQRRLFIGILCKLADSTSDAPNTLTPDQRDYILLHGDNDIYEQIVEDLLLDSQNQYRPTTFAQDLLSPEYAATIRPRLRLGMAWRGLTGNDNESVDHMISADWLAVAKGVLRSIWQENKEVPQDIWRENDEADPEQTNAQKLLIAELKDEMDALGYFVMVKSKDKEQVEKALAEYYLLKDSMSTDDKTLIASAYAYNLRDYKTALEHIDPAVQSGEKLDPVLFSIVVDCWSKQGTTIPRDIVDKYIGAVSNSSNDKAKNALANIVCAYVSQQLEDDNLNGVDLLDKIALPDSPGTRGYIELRIDRLKLEVLKKQGRYEEVDRLFNGADKNSGVSLSGAAENGVVYMPVSFSLNRENEMGGIGAIFVEAELPGEAKRDAGSGLLERLDSLERDYKDKLDPQLIASLRNDVLRQLAQVKEAQGFYEEALEHLGQVKTDFIAYEDERIEAQIYDELQRVGLYIKLNKMNTAAESLKKVEDRFAELEEILNVAGESAAAPKTLAEQKEIYYSRKVALAGTGELETIAEDGDLPINYRCRAYLKLLDQAAETKDKELATRYFEALATLTSETVELPVELQLLKHVQEAAYLSLNGVPNRRLSALGDAERLIPQLPLDQQKAYKNLLAELRAYATLEVRDYAALRNNEFPKADTFAKGLEYTRHALTMRSIYWNYLAEREQENPDVLAGLNEELKRVKTEAELKQNVRNEGLRDLLQNYKAELLLLQYNYLFTHFMFSKEGKNIGKKAEDIKAQLEEVLKDLPLSNKTSIERRLETSQLGRKDTPSYDIIEKELWDKIENTQIEGDFWEDKRKLDHLLDLAVSLGGKEEIIAAVNILYGLRLEDLPNNPFAISSVSDDTNALSLVEKVKNFRKKFFDANEGQMPGFEFTAAEKGYGYYILLRLCDAAANSSDAAPEYTARLEALKPLLAGYLVREANKYWPESAVLITDFINEDRTKNKENSQYANLNNLLPVNPETPDDGSLISAYRRMGEALGNDDLKRAIEIAENAFGLPHGKYAETNINTFKTKYDTWVQADQDSLDYQGYSAEKMLLELISCLVRQRAEGTVNWNTDERIIKLLEVFEAYEPVNGYYFGLKYQTLLLQYHTALKVVTKYKDYGPEFLPNYLDTIIPGLLRNRKDEALSVAEQSITEYIANALTWKLPQSKPNPPSDCALPQEALYLYSNLLHRLAAAELTLAEKTGNGAQRSLYLARAEMLQNMLKVLDSAHSALLDLQGQTAKSSKSLLTLTPQYSERTEKKTSGYSYDWENEDYLDTERNEAAISEVYVAQEQEQTTKEFGLDITSDLWKHLGLSPRVYLGGGWIDRQRTDSVSARVTDPDSGQVLMDEEGNPRVPLDADGQPIEGKYSQDSYESKFFTFGLGLDWYPVRNKLFGDRFVWQDSVLGFDFNWRWGFERLSPYDEHLWAEYEQKQAEAEGRAKRATDEEFSTVDSYYALNLGSTFTLRGLENFRLGIKDVPALSIYEGPSVKNTDDGFSIESKKTYSLSNEVTLTPGFTLGRVAADLSVGWLYKPDDEKGKSKVPLGLGLNYFGAQHVFGLSARLDNMLNPAELSIGVRWQWQEYGLPFLQAGISWQDGKINGGKIGFSWSF